MVDGESESSSAQQRRVPTLSAKKTEKGGAPRTDAFAPEKIMGEAVCFSPLNMADTNR